MRSALNVALTVAGLVLCGWIEAAGPASRAAPGGDRLPAAGAAEAAGLDQVRALVQNGNYLEAAGRARELLPRFEAAYGPDSEQTADLLDLLSEALRRGGKPNDREPRALAERALRIKEKLFGPNDPAVAVSLFNLASATYVAGDLEQARPIFERALAIRRKALGEEHPLVAETMDYLGNLLLDLGDETGSGALFQGALEIREKAFGRESLEVAWSLSSIAKLHFYAGDYDKALPLYNRALSIREKGLKADHPLVASSLNNVATVLEAKGDYAGAIPLWERALALRKAKYRPDDPLLAAAMERLGGVYLKTGDFAAAKSLFEKGLEIRQNALGPDHPEVVWSLEHLADLHAATGDDAEARRLQERGLGIREKALEPDDPLVARSLVALANLSFQQKDYASAKQLYERALAIQEKEGSDEEEVARTLDNLASLLQATGRSAEAEPLFERSLRILEKALGPRHPDVAQTLNHLAMAQADLGERQAALEATLRAEEMSREHYRLTGPVLTERQALVYASIGTTGLDFALSLAADGLGTIPGARPKVYDALIRSRSLVLDEMAARHHLMQDSGDRDVARLASELRSITTQLANLVVRGAGEDSPERYRSHLERALEEKAATERALAAKSAAFRQTRAREQVGLRQVVDNLPADGALVSYAEYAVDEGAHRYLAFVLRAGEKQSAVAPTIVPIGEVTEIDELIRAWREEAARGALAPGRSVMEAEASCRLAGEALRRRIWDPLRPGLRGAKRVFVVPDGALHLVSIAALPQDGRYLIESGPLVHYLSTERDLAPAQRPRQRGGQMLAVGQPDFDQAAAASAPARVATFRGEPSRCGGFQAMRFGSLPATEQEVREVTDLWDRQPAATSVRLTGPLASEAALKQNAPGKRILHIATHGFFLGKECVSGAPSSRGLGRLAPAEEWRLPAAVGENPLLLSGLALAGANDRQRTGSDQEDGILTAEEIAAMDLSGVEWAVLSACDTGTGEVVAGEGVFGLRRALQVAGAATVIMSLWSVEDETARRWMRALYEGRLVRGLGTAEAVRAASLEMLRQRREQGLSTHPFYWAGFIAAGDWR